MLWLRYACKHSASIAEVALLLHMHWLTGCEAQVFVWQHVLLRLTVSNSFRSSMTYSLTTVFAVLPVASSGCTHCSLCLWQRVLLSCAVLQHCSAAVASRVSLYTMPYKPENVFVHYVRGLCCITFRVSARVTDRAHHFQVTAAVAVPSRPLLGCNRPYFAVGFSCCGVTESIFVTSQTTSIDLQGATLTRP